VPKGSNVIDLMAALKKSLGDDKKAKPAARKPAAKRAPTRAHSRKAAPARKRA
jgi:DNA end-binding protein Ku